MPTIHSMLMATTQRIVFRSFYMVTKVVVSVDDRSWLKAGSLVYLTKASTSRTKVGHMDCINLVYNVYLHVIWNINTGFIYVQITVQPRHSMTTRFLLTCISAFFSTRKKLSMDCMISLLMMHTICTMMVWKLLVIELLRFSYLSKYVQEVFQGYVDH